ncbi:MAG: signal peptidase I [Oscillospiraceae bacterium]|nr:signal peptidase I [Oscillospiraceae bacterium]
MGWFKKKEKKTDEASEVKLTWQQSLITDIRDVLYVLAGFMIVYMLFFRVVVVVGPSMYDTLVDGDRLVLVSNVLYTEPEQGDIIVASKNAFRNGECIVKRVIATEGQHVDIDFARGIVYVDGEALDESLYITGETTRREGMTFPLVVEEGHVFVMGDNRDDSMDSRDPAIGLIDEREILGKVVFLLTPGTNGGTQEPDYARIGVVE